MIPFRGTAKEIDKAEVRMLQYLTLAVVNKRLTGNSIKKSSWNVMFADDIVICCKSKKKAEY